MAVDNGEKYRGVRRNKNAVDHHRHHLEVGGRSLGGAKRNARRLEGRGAGRSETGVRAEVIQLLNLSGAALCGA